MTEAQKDNYWRRIRENCIFGVIVLAIVLVFVFSVFIGLTTNDLSRQTFAQALATTIVGAIGGGLAGYFTAKREA
ncbi:MAG: hypothetical protein QM692_13750 [Thermomicrobiales bacterium]